MQNSNQVLENKFDHLYFHAKAYVKRKKIKIMCSTSLKRSGHVASKIGDLETNLTTYTFMQNLKLKGNKKASVVLHRKEQIM